MEDMAEAFNALKEWHKKRKASNYIENMEVIKQSDIEYRQDGNRTVLIKTNVGTLSFYPTTNKFMLKSKVYFGNAKNMLGFIKNRGLEI